jgi:flagellar hook-associated protein FlgK
MSDLLGIASSGISAYQRALSTVSNNIANVNTEGYSRQEISLAANAPRLLGGSYLGTGAMFNGVRRQYDSFIESNLRSSNSELKGQEPMVSYVNRLIDVMGDQSIGLTTALNQFFKSSRDLATDPASTVQRSNFLRESDSVSARFRELDSQFELLEIETRQAVENDIGKLNSLTSQLAQLNKQLTKHAVVDKQPAELLDQRDKLLKDLSALAATKTLFKDNGEVVVSVGDVISRGLLVDGSRSREIGLSNAPGVDARKLQFVIDPYGTTETLPSLVSGTIGGTLSFREYVLNPASESLDRLAQTLAEQANAVHRGGIDLQGRVGLDLFRIESNPRGAAAGIQVALTDASRVAAAGQFRVTDALLNTGDAKASIRYAAPTFASLDGLYGALSQAGAPQIVTESLEVKKSQPLGVLGVASQGMRDLILSLGGPATAQVSRVAPFSGSLDAGDTVLVTIDGTTFSYALATGDDSAQVTAGLVDLINSPLTGMGSSAVTASVGENNALILTAKETGPSGAFSVIASASSQVITGGNVTVVTSGEDIQTAAAGQSLQVLTRDGRHLLGTELSADQQALVMSTTRGMEVGATYSSAYLGKPFLGMDLFLGARAGVRLEQEFDPDTGAVTDPTLLPAMLQGRSITSGLTTIEEGTYVLSGVTLGALSAEEGSTLSATDLADWINGYSDETGVEATVDGDALVLSRASSNTTDDIRLAAGSAGSALSLAELGFDSAVHLNGEAADDLLIFVTTDPAASTSVVKATAQFTQAAGDPKQALRAQALEVRFTDTDRYEIWDTDSDVMVAERDYDTDAANFSYRGITLQFSAALQTGDTFSIDGNQDGIGNNESMIEIANLEDKRLETLGNLTLTEAYIERVSEVGSVAQQASISRDALKVVYQQALEARDSLAGVSLDEEAASLVRYQQAYQANAKVMQVANDLFDAILQVR